jgi:hypothetical protein
VVTVVIGPNQGARYTCEGCGATTNLDPEAAFQAGWDTPERFMSHCTCPRCPINVTLWWRLVVEKQDPATLTDDEKRLLIHYNQVFTEYNEQPLQE